MHPKIINSALKNLEAPFLYNYVVDERYELDPESFNFLKHCTGKNSFEEVIKKSKTDQKDADELVNYLVGESCLDDNKTVEAPLNFEVSDPVSPSLRYLQLNITEKCNLDCAHCYLGKKEKHDLPLPLIKKSLDEFSPNGLKVLLTGGEPLMHNQIWEVLEYAKNLPIRKELFSNGILITKNIAKKLSEYVQAVQISLDGLENSHELIRGKGTFKKTLEGIENASQYLDVNIATMVHPKNLNQFEELSNLVHELGVAEWNLDIPSLAGNATIDLIPKANEAAEIFRVYGFGTGVHEGDMEFSCGSHICTIDIHGNVSKCGFFEEGVGNIEDEKLTALWKKVVDKYTPPVNVLSCKDCSVVETCRGGCRFRAKLEGDFYGKDSFMCSVHLGG